MLPGASIATGLKSIMDETAGIWDQWGDWNCSVHCGAAEGLKTDGIKAANFRVSVQLIDANAVTMPILKFAQSEGL